MEKYEEKHKHQPSWGNWEKYCIKNFKAHFGENSLLSNIRYVDVETYKNQIRQKLTKHGTVRRDAAVSREMGVLRHIFRKAVEWDMISESAFDKGRSLQLKENNERMRYLTEEEVEKLLQECKPLNNDGDPDRRREHLYWIV